MLGLMFIVQFLELTPTLEGICVYILHRASQTSRSVCLLQQKPV